MYRYYCNNYVSFSINKINNKQKLSVTPNFNYEYVRQYSVA